MYRERLGIDRPLVVAASGTQILDKREKEAVNLVARASGEGRAIVRPHPAKDPFEPWEMTAQEREVASKYVRLIQYHCPTRYTIKKLFYDSFTFSCAVDHWHQRRRRPGMEKGCSQSP